MRYTIAVIHFTFLTGFETKFGDIFLLSFFLGTLRTCRWNWKELDSQLSWDPGKGEISYNFDIITQFLSCKSSKIGLESRYVWQSPASNLQRIPWPGAPVRCSSVHWSVTKTGYLVHDCVQVYRGNIKMCILKEKVCDGNTDCDDNSDERLCTFCVPGKAFICQEWSEFRVRSGNIFIFFH